MIFITLELSADGVVEAIAKGHFTDVAQEFQRVSGILLGSRGPWRITKVHGLAPLVEKLDSDMGWNLTAESKDRGV